MDLVGEDPEIAAELVRGAPGVKLPALLAVSLAPTDMSAVVPAQYLADMVVLITDAKTGKPVLAVIIEPQLRSSKTKQYSGRSTSPPCAASPNARRQCWWCCALTRPRPASAASRSAPGTPASTGADRHRLERAARRGRRQSVPDGVCREHGRHRHGHRGRRRMVLDAMASPGVSDADRRRMITIMLRLSDDAVRQSLEAMMKTREYEKTFIERIHDEGIAEGKAEAVLRLLDARGVSLSPEQRQRVTSSTDPAQLNLWFDRAITASTAAEVFAD